jgi:hypothetical protein
LWILSPTDRWAAIAPEAGKPLICDTIFSPICWFTWGS